TAFEIAFAIGGLPAGSTITRIRAGICPRVGAQLPTTPPSLVVLRTDSSNHSPSALVGSVVDSTAGSHGTYETPHELDITGLSSPVDGGHFMATVRSAAGTLLGQTELHYIIVTVE